MKIKKIQSHRKLIIISTAVILAVGIVGVAYAINQRNNGSSAENDVNYDQPSQDEKKAGEDTKRQTIDDSMPTKDESDNGTTNSSEVTVTLTAASQNQETVNIRANIGRVTTSGTCTLSMTSQKTGQIYSAQAGVQPLPSSSTCKGFDIPVSSLEVGTWNILVTYADTGLSGKASGTVEIK